MSSLSEEVNRSKSSFLTRLFLRSHRARQATASVTAGSGATSAVIPGGSTATSAGASKNAAELSRHLDLVLSEVGKDGSLDIEQDDLAVHLWEASESYTNSMLPKGLPEWNCSRDEIKLIKLAALASRTVYHKLVLPEIGEESVETNVFSSTKYFSASSDGNIKAASLSHLMTDDCSTLFIAIRGSASLMDWLVNADGDPVEVGENFLPRPTNGTEAYRSHRGLLRVAIHMVLSLKNEIELFLDDQERRPFTGNLRMPDIVLTGHSAGGGVAALVFAHLVLFNDKIHKRLRHIHLITFGAPPIFPPALNTKLSELYQNTAGISQNHESEECGTRRGLFVSIVNQGDPVVRADQAYIRSLIELYTKTRPAEPIDVSSELLKKEWTLPAIELVNAGIVIVAHDAKADMKETDWRLRIIDQQILGGLVWGNVKAHGMKVYETAIKGCFGS